MDTDEALVLRSRQGDREAFEELVRRTARLVFARVYLETGEVHRTEDLVQETFLTAWRSIHQVTEPGGFRSWLLHVAHSAVVDAQRRDSRKKRSAGKKAAVETLDGIETRTAGPDQVAEEREERERALSVLRSLPEEYRMPLTLRYIGGADYESIGRQLGLTNGSLRGMLSRGLELLRRQMGVGDT